ncbi:MAG: glycerol-3-phosphate 1-O-acyltransferase PlsY [Fimbriimonadaceae bacterium]|nr:glycerol-3-phosphate 1-O-acyltransferase PlsY [Fimbriimonadaceae bacterium]
MVAVAVYLVAYLLGSVPFGLLVARAHGVDILSTGSGNIGTTNIGRVLGKGPAALVFVLDVAKGLVPPLVAKSLVADGVWGISTADHAVLVGLCAILGHTASPFLRFKGGKGIATGLGVLTAATPGVAGTALGSFILLFALTQTVSVASIASVIGMVAGAVVLRQSHLCVVVYSLLAAYVVFKHRANIVRLTKGEEPKFKFKK